MWASGPRPGRDRRRPRAGVLPQLNRLIPPNVLTMSPSDMLFYLFAALTLLFGALVVANPFSRNPVTSAMFLVLTLLSLAGLFVLLNAFFLAAVQVLVYAGAVMVLFLFVIMLLDLGEERRRRVRKFGLITGVASVGALVSILIMSLRAARPAAGLVAPQLQGTTAPLGKLLLTRYLLPFEVISILLLVAMVGAILLGKKQPK